VRDRCRNEGAHRRAPPAAPVVQLRGWTAASWTDVRARGSRGVLAAVAGDGHGIRGGRRTPRKSSCAAARPVNRVPRPSRASTLAATSRSDPQVSRQMAACFVSLLRPHDRSPPPPPPGKRGSRGCSACAISRSALGDAVPDSSPGSIGAGLSSKSSDCRRAIDGLVYVATPILLARRHPVVGAAVPPCVVRTGRSPAGHAVAAGGRAGSTIPVDLAWDGPEPRGLGSWVPMPGAEAQLVGGYRAAAPLLSLTNVACGRALRLAWPNRRLVSGSAAWSWPPVSI
jgi:hypothetical protein